MLSGASPSVMRAVVMFSILSGSQLLFRRNSHLNGLFLSALVLILHNPLVIFDIGFQLSYAAMLGIFLFYEPILNIKSFQNKASQWIWEGTAVGLAATLFTIPLTLFWFYQFPNYFLLANIGVMVFGFFVLLLGLLFLISSWIPFVSKIIVFIFSLSIVALVDWVAWIDSLPGSVSGGFHLSAFQVIVAYSILIFWILALVRSINWKFFAMTLSVLFVGWITVERWNQFSQSELLILRSKELILIVNTPYKSMAFYELKRGESAKIPRELSSYLIYSGEPTQTIPLQHSQTTFKMAKNRFELTKKKEGWEIIAGKHRYFYRSKGIPQKNENPQLMSIGLQTYLNPNADFEVFRHRL